MVTVEQAAAAVGVGGAAVCVGIARRRQLRWGATDAEVTADLPGDNLLPRADGGPEAPTTPGVYLYWLPLGAGARVVRISGKVFEAITARLGSRPRRDLYHSALEVVTPDARFVIEMTPMADRNGSTRGVVAEGVVGSKWARPFRVLRYEIRRWRGGSIADIAAAIDSPVRGSESAAMAERVLDLVPRVRRPYGAATSCTPARCGTPTQSPLGSLSAAVSTSLASDRHQTVEHPAGTQAWRSRDESPPYSR